jgi:peptide/nickel transport system substrate-binding protein
MRASAAVLLGVAAALLAGVAVVRCGVEGAPAGERAQTPALGGGVPQGHVFTGAADEPDDINPLTSHNLVGRRLLLAYTHEALLDIDPASGDLRPALAASWQVDADGGGCTFTLRDGVLFADGSAVTMDDVLFGWRLAAAGHLALGQIADAFARVRAVEVLDERRFHVAFRTPHYAALRVVGESWLVVQQRFFVARVAAKCAPEPPPPLHSREFALLVDQIDRECGPGTGPYQLENAPDGPQRWRPRQEVLLVRNPHCWRRRHQPGTWNFDGIRVLFRDQAGATNALLRGEVDWYSSPQLAELLQKRPELAQQYRELVYDYDALGVYRVVWNCRQTPTDDPRVRRALGMLVDVAALQRACPGLGAPAVAHCKPDSPGCPPDLQPLPFGIAAARGLLREAGYAPEEGRPLRVTIVALQGTDVLRRMADLLEDGARQAGVALDLRRRDYVPFMHEKKAGQWHGLLVQQMFRPWGDPWDLLHSRGLDNDGGYANVEVDRLLDAARVERDPAQRAEHWQRAHRLVHADQPAALLVHPLACILLDRRIEQASTGRTGLVLERAFVAVGRQRR